jgi:hypothetical protein
MSLAVPSIIRMEANGAAWCLSLCQTPSLSSSRIEGIINAVVRWSGLDCSGAAMETSNPACANASAAAMPAGPFPATTMSVVIVSVTIAHFHCLKWKM